VSIVQEDLSHTLLVYLVADLDGEEGVVLEGGETRERGAQLLFPAVLESLRFRGAESLNEGLDDLVAFADP
jgi:hypothetical protein